MGYNLEFTPKAKKDVEEHQKAGNKALLNKLWFLLDELSEHPFTGTGKPEPLKHNLFGHWTRRINREHRMLYRVDGDKVFVISLKGHT